MSIERLENLFLSADLAQCIEEGEQYLKNHTEDTAVLYLMALAHYDYVYPGHPELVFKTLTQYTLPYLEKIVSLEPGKPEPRYHILNYTLNNDEHLAQFNLTKRHLSVENYSVYMNHAQHLILDPGHAIYGYDFLIRIYELAGDKMSMLKTLDEGLSFLSVYFKADREQRDLQYSIFFMRKIYLVQEYKLLPDNEIVNLIASQLLMFASENDSDYLYLAEIAFENNDITLAKVILLQLIRGANDEDDVLEGLVKWHRRFDQLEKNGLADDDILYFQLIIERNHYEWLHLKADHYYEHALRLIDTHPDKFSPFHFAGTYLHEQASHAEALNFLSNALEIKLSSTTWRRYFVSKFLATGTIDVDTPTFEDLPRDLYNDGVELGDFIEKSISDPEQLSIFNAVLSRLYEQSFLAFEGYFEEGLYASDFLGSRHNWAMCCNNHGLLLIKNECYGTASNVASIGLQQSDFEELHHTLLDALLKSEDYTNAKTALTRFFSIYKADNSNFYFYLKHQADYLVVKIALNESENSLIEAKDLLFKLYDHHVLNPDISDYDFRDYEAAKNTVEGVIYTIYEEESLEDKINYYKSIAEIYPNETQPQYVLMQLYNERDDYRQVGHWARLYLANKKEFIINAFDKAKTLYLIAKSHYLLEEYALGKDFFTQHDSFCEMTFDAPEYLHWLLYGVKLFAAENQLEPLLIYSSKLEQVYVDEDWEYDEIAEQVHLLVANAHYTNGDLKRAHHYLDIVLKYDNHTALADEYKSTWKKAGLFSKFF